MQQIDYRGTYHAVRRASTTVSKSNSGRWWINRPHSIGDALRAAKAVKVKRGGAEFRDKAARVLLERQPPGKGESLDIRLRRYVATKYEAEILRRGGEIEIVGENSTTGLYAADRDIANKLVLLHCEGWRYYSRRFGSRPAALSYLCGEDDNGPFAVRVAGTITTVAEAIEFLEPAEVKKARDAGRKVLRQGDVYVIEMKRDAADNSDLPPRHTWDADKRELRHDDGHGALSIPFPCKFVTQSAFRMGRIDSHRPRGRGD